VTDDPDVEAALAAFYAPAATALPALLPQSVGGELLPFLSAKRRTEIIDRVFEATGGETAMAEWVEKSDDNRGKFYGWFVKGAFRGSAPAPVEDRGTKVEELLARLDAGEGAKVINNDD
jgi:hypothetical protein